MKHISQPVVKKDAYALLSGKPVYTGDMVPKDALILKLLRSPHAYARIKAIDTSAALKIPGVVAVYTWKDVPDVRFTLAGQTYPEPSPYDRKILDEIVRYVGDEVAIIAAETLDAAEKAMKLIKVDYEVYEPLLDFTKAIDNDIIVHQEDNYRTLCEIGNARMRNICSQGESCVGDIDAAFTDCDVILLSLIHISEPTRH